MRACRPQPRAAARAPAGVSRGAEWSTAARAAPGAPSRESAEATNRSTVGRIRFPSAPSLKKYSAAVASVGTCGGKRKHAAGASAHGAGRRRATCGAPRSRLRRACAPKQPPAHPTRWRRGSPAQRAQLARRSRGAAQHGALDQASRAWSRPEAARFADRAAVRPAARALRSRLRAPAQAAARRRRRARREAGLPRRERPARPRGPPTPSWIPERRLAAARELPAAMRTGAARL